MTRRSLLEAILAAGGIPAVAAEVQTPEPLIVQPKPLHSEVIPVRLRPLAEANDPEDEVDTIVSVWSSDIRYGYGARTHELVLRCHPRAFLRGAVCVRPRGHAAASEATTRVRDHYDRVLVTAAKAEMDRVLLGR
jgi:hypothetical protein